MWDGHLGRIGIIAYRIKPLQSSNFVNLAPYQVGCTAREFHHLEMEKMLSQNVIEPAQTIWAAPIVFAPKKEGSLRFPVKYRNLNNLTRRDANPIPRMNECIDPLGGATGFSALDDNSGNWRKKIEDEDQDKTALTLHHDLYRFVRMPLGLKNALGTFQKAVDLILASDKCQFALVYLNDIVIFLKTLEKQIDHVKQVLTLLYRSGSHLN